METTYADENNGGAFTENYIPELTKLAQENEDFSGETTDLNGGHTVEGTTWTMAGMFAQTSGLPLKTSIDAIWIRRNISSRVLRLWEIY